MHNQSNQHLRRKQCRPNTYTQRERESVIVSLLFQLSLFFFYYLGFRLYFSMVERGRRKPLVLSSTKALLNSLLLSSSSITNQRGDGIDPSSTPNNLLHLPAGILRFSFKEDQTLISSLPNLVSLDDAVLVGLSTSALKSLSITSGSLVLLFLNYFHVVCMLSKLRQNWYKEMIEMNGRTHNSQLNVYIREALLLGSIW